ncbi:MAG TPA: lysophospholipid acyltransferase family protein, partial [Roseivirga sp.]
MIFRIIAVLPQWLVYAIADFLWFWVFKVFGYRRKVIRNNIRSCFPEFSETKVKRVSNQFGRQFLHVLGEAIFCYHFKDKEWEERVVVENASKVKAYLKENKTVLLVYGHMTNWEWPLVSLGKVLGVPTEFLYRPMENDSVDKTLLEFREKHGGKGLHKDKAIRHILKHKNKPRVIGLVGDQIPSMGTEKRWLDFFGIETAFYVGIEKIALATDSPVFFLDVVRTGRGKYHYTFHEIAKPPYET